MAPAQGRNQPTRLEASSDAEFAADKLTKKVDDRRRLAAKLDDCKLKSAQAVCCVTINDVDRVRSCLRDGVKCLVRSVSYILFRCN